MENGGLNKMGFGDELGEMLDRTNGGDTLEENCTKDNPRYPAQLGASGIP